jgi:N-carbamoyl-L-amino-acid hydrolase
MNRRQDAMLAAARFTLMVNRVVTSKPGRQVGTVGRISALPGAPNVIPGKVVLSLELRELDEAKVHALFAEISAEATKIGKQNGTTFAFKQTNVNHPAPTDPRMRAAIEKSARELGLTTRAMPSGAGHDAQEMARIGPAGMIFVPSVKGISHAPAEFSRPADIENGANVLLQTLLRIDAELA